MAFKVLRSLEKNKIRKTRKPLEKDIGSTYRLTMVELVESQRTYPVHSQRVSFHGFCGVCFHAAPSVASRRAVKAVIVEAVRSACVDKGSRQRRRRRDIVARSGIG